MRRQPQRPARKTLFFVVLPTLLCFALELSAQESYIASPDEDGTVPVSGVVRSPEDLPRSVTLPDWLKLGAEYRVETLYLNPLDLSGTEVREAFWTEQRMRLDLGLRVPGEAGIYAKFDILDGTLFGDNGDYGSVPAPNSGLALVSKGPNVTGWEVALLEGADPLATNSYVPSLKALEPIRLTHLYGEVNLPIGLLRIGRMPTSEGAAIAAHDGERRNRWGVSRYPDVADRVLFATKLDEAVKVIQNGPEYRPDTSHQRGIILAGTYDWSVIDSISSLDDDTWQTNLLLSFRQDEADWLGWDWQDFRLNLLYVHRRGEKFGTVVHAFPMSLSTTIGDAYINLQLSYIRGQTSEIAEGLAELSNKEPEMQDLNMIGAHVYCEYDFGPVALALEADYASSDGDPRTNSPFTSFSFSRDFNVGLLLFEHILAFQSARAAAVGIENLSQLDAESFPVTEIATQGRFNNALALFPQLDIRWLEGPKHWFHTRLGVLAAWAPKGSIDPINTTLREDGEEIADDAINFYGGKPGSYYGTEIDLQLEWSFGRHFQWTIEGAVLFPGDALYDENRMAVNSFLLENRFLFLF